MSSEPVDWSVDGRGLRFAIVVARFNNAITGRLLSAALEALIRAGAASGDIEVVKVPGSFELPLIAKALAQRGRHDAIIALGAVIRGETPHFDHVAAQAAAGLQQVALSTGVPVAFGVLTTNTPEQAAARAGGEKGNKGADAAMTAIEMAALLRRLRA